MVFQYSIDNSNFSNVLLCIAFLIVSKKKKKKKNYWTAKVKRYEISPWASRKRKFRGEIEDRHLISWYWVFFGTISRHARLSSVVSRRLNSALESKKKVFHIDESTREIFSEIGLCRAHERNQSETNGTLQLVTSKWSKDVEVCKYIKYIVLLSPYLNVTFYFYEIY